MNFNVVRDNQNLTCHNDKTVLHVITGLNDGGAESVLVSLCQNSKNIRHVVVSLIDEGKYGSILRKSGVTVYSLNMKPAAKSIFDIFKLIKLIRSEKPDIVQTWMYHADLAGGIAARLAGVRNLYWGVHHSVLEKGLSKRSTIMIARICALLSGWLPKKIICCANKAKIVHDNLGYAARKLCVIPNGYDLSRFRPDNDARNRVRAEFGLGSHEFIIGNVARFDPLKDHSNLLQALAQVKKRNIPFRCLLIGKGLSPKNPDLMGQIAKLALQDNVLLIGQCSDVPAIMNALDLHVLSSLSEGFPNVLSEAMACGTPCISTDVGDASEILGDQKVCCPSRDSRALADIIIELALEWQSIPSSWEARKAASRRRISEKYSIENMVEAYETCWFDTHEAGVSGR